MNVVQLEGDILFQPYVNPKGNLCRFTVRPKGEKAGVDLTAWDAMAGIASTLKVGDNVRVTARLAAGSDKLLQFVAPEKREKPVWVTRITVDNPAVHKIEVIDGGLVQEDEDAF